MNDYIIAEYLYIMLSYQYFTYSQTRSIKYHLFCALRAPSVSENTVGVAARPSASCMLACEEVAEGE
jgi:hypothetical protein